MALPKPANYWLDSSQGNYDEIKFYTNIPGLLDFVQKLVPVKTISRGRGWGDANIIVLRWDYITTLEHRKQTIEYIRQQIDGYVREHNGS